MNDAKKMAGIALLFLFAVAFINRGQVQISSGPSGASATGGFFGLVK